MMSNNNNSRHNSLSEAMRSLEVAATQLDPLIPPFDSTHRREAPAINTNNSNSKISLYSAMRSLEAAANQLDPPIPSTELGSRPRLESAGTYDREEHQTESRRRISRELTELTRTLDALLLANFDNQDFDKYRAIFYEKKGLFIMMADHKEFNADPTSWTQMGRDSARLFAVKAGGTFPRTIDTISPDHVYPGVHCQSSVNELRHLIRNMKDAYGEDFEAFDSILTDYIRIPDNWLRENLSPKFFSEVLRYFLANDRVLKPGGTIFLPNTPYVFEQLSLNFDLLSPLCESIRFVHDPTLNELYRATEVVDDQLRISASKSCNDNALNVLLSYAHMPKGTKKAPFIAMIKRGSENGDMVIDLTSKLYDKELTSPFCKLAPGERAEKRHNNKRVREVLPPTPIKRNKTRNYSGISSSASSSSSSPLIDLTSDEEQPPMHRSSSGIKGRVSFTP